MVIFGWGYQRQSSKILPFQGKCSSCNNTVDWYLVRVSTWFTLFFIPIFPYSRKAFVLCPICGSGIEIDRSFIKQLEYPNISHQELQDMIESGKEIIGG